MTNVKFCNCCKEDREKKNRALRILAPFHDDLFKIVVNGKRLFNKEDIPVYFCEHCDGDALPRARNEMLKRTP